ncbi:MAG: glycine cleavage system aminomethyltransferase GcvT [Spirochaetales bacterium]|nr:MAG: glycine cleavage system aminomethyltransferase GcvT [Spirochaetales bacterium]
MLKLPLHDIHVSAGARMTEFADWNMPLQYTGIIAEHRHTRQHASLFDVSHMGEFQLSGPSALADLELLLTCSVSSLSTGRCRYGFLLNESAGILDDLFVYRLSGDSFMLVVNAGTREKDLWWIGKHLSASTRAEDITGITVKLDLQGPEAVNVMAEVFHEAARSIGDLKRFHAVKMELAGLPVLVSRTGYTGEDGFELYLTAKTGLADKAAQLWQLLVSHPAVKPAGLGARDTLRLEMGYPLYGSDIDESRTPADTDRMKYADLSKEFIGREALLIDEEAGSAARVLTGFICSDRRAARHGFSIEYGGRTAGVVTSGSFSPALSRGIGLCYLDSDLVLPGTAVELTDGRTRLTGVITSPPFI